MPVSYRHGLALAILATLVTGCWIGWNTPRREKVADCTNSILESRLTVKADPGYHFAIGIPFKTNLVEFDGTITISQSTGTVIHVPISSGDLTRATGSMAEARETVMF